MIYSVRLWRRQRLAECPPICELQEMLGIHRRNTYYISSNPSPDQMYAIQHHPETSIWRKGDSVMKLHEAGPKTDVL